MLLEELFDYGYVIVYLDGQVCQQMTPMMWWLHCEGCCVFSGVGMRGLQLGMFGIGGFVAEGKEGQSFLEGGPCGVW